MASRSSPPGATSPTRSRAWRTSPRRRCRDRAAVPPPAAIFASAPRIVARSSRLVALLGRLAVRADVPDPAADGLVAAARLRAGRSVAQRRDDRDAGAARARAAARSDAGAEGVARRRADGTRRSSSSSSRPCRTTSSTRSSCASRSSRPSRRPRRSSPRRRHRRRHRLPQQQPPRRRRLLPRHRRPTGRRRAQLPCDWSGDSGGEGMTRNKHFLGDRPGFVAINYNLYVRPDDIKVIYRGQVIAGTARPAQRPRRLRLRLEAGRRGLFGRCHRNR